MKDILDLIQEIIIDLTDRDKLCWRREFITLNCAETDRWSFVAEELPDEKPSLSIDDKNQRQSMDINQSPTLIIKDYSVRELLRAIDNQYKRKKMYEYAEKGESMA